MSFRKAHPAVTWTWDTATGAGKGRLASVFSSASTTAFSNYDGLGRPHGSSQTTPTNSQTSYSFTYTYQPAGLATVAYPTGRTLAYSYDYAGRLAGLSGSLSSHQTNYASSISYAANSQSSQMTIGNQLVEQTQFNPRWQPCAIRLGATAVTPGSSCPTDLSGMQSGLLYLVYGYGATNNNGNLLSQQIGVSDPAQSLSWSQTYGYDGVNRLTTAQESLQTPAPPLPSGVTANNWNATNGYDAYGNRWESASWAVGGLTATASGQFNTANNRLQYLNDSRTAMPADAYDGTGNLTDHPSLGQMVYDGENRLKQYTDGGNQTLYTYDGDGRRVTKTVTGAAQSSTTYVYDASGELAAEYSTVAPGDSGTTYLTADHLGSTRLVTDGSGHPLHRFDYAPFGEDLSGLGLGNRNLMTSYNVSSGPTIKFTGKERDAETGLDYFGARYFSSAQGRFTSPDWSAVPQAVPYADLKDPQTLNLYTYVRNNPLSRPDRDGHQQCPLPNGQCSALVQQAQAAQAAQKAQAQQAVEAAQNQKTNQATSATPQQQQPQRGLTVGVGVAGNVDVGVGVAGAEANASAVVTGSISSTGQPSAAAAVSGGAVAYAGDHVAAAPTQWAPPVVAGAYAGGGLTFLVANTASGTQLSGPFQTIAGNVGGGAGASVNLSFDATGTFVFQVTVGPGIGASGWSVTTNTCVAGTSGSGCK